MYNLRFLSIWEYRLCKVLLLVLFWRSEMREYWVLGRFPLFGYFEELFYMVLNINQSYRRLIIFEESRVISRNLHRVRLVIMTIFQKVSYVFIFYYYSVYRRLDEVEVNNFEFFYKFCSYETRVVLLIFNPS